MVKRDFRPRPPTACSGTAHDDGGGKRVYTRDIRARHPRLAPRSTYNTTPANFKREYLSRLSDQLGWYFYEHHHGDDIPDAT